MPSIAGASMTWMPSDAVAKCPVWVKLRSLSAQLEVRLARNNGHRQPDLSGPKSANSRSDAYRRRTKPLAV